MVDSNGAVGSGPVVRITRASTADRADAVVDAARDAAASVRVAEVGSTGAERLEPLAAATLDGATALFSDVTPDRVRSAVETLADGTLPTEGADATVDHEVDRATLPLTGIRPLGVGVRRALGRCGWVEPTNADGYDEFAAEGIDPEDALDSIRGLGLLGRGRGDGSTDAPVADEWETARGTVDAGDPVVVVNAHESDGRVRADRLLVESAPLDVLDAAAVVARVVGATDLLVYCNEADELAVERARDAAAAFEDGVDADGPSIQVATGPDTYIAGEMTMALEAMEGNDRLEARLRPPSPAAHGLYGRPTVIHTPRTLAQVREALLRPERFDPADADPGTRLVTVSGDVDGAATVELPTGGSLGAARDAAAMDGPFKMACVGGQFGGLTRSLDLPPSAPALKAAGLGTNGAVELLNAERCAVATAGTRSRFARDGNCGRCVPCREGSKQLLDMLRDVYGGEYEDGRIRELTRVMVESSTCEFGQTAPRPVVTAMSEFETEFEAHAEGRCPSGACEGGAT